MRIVRGVLVAVLAVRPGLVCLAAPQERTSPPTRTDSMGVAPARNENSHGHIAETQPGTPPCGYGNAKCGSNNPAPAARHDDHTGRNVAIGVGAGALAGLVLYKIASHRSDHVKTLSEKGPQFPELLHMSKFQVTGFVRGSWPVVLDYQAEPGAYALLSIAAEGAAPLTATLPTQQNGRQMVRILIPPTLGTDLKMADFTIVSTISPSDQRLAYFRVYGFGAGPRAVGSVAIDQLKFGPGVITASQPETQIAFHAHNTFDRVRAEFMQLEMIDNCLENKQFDDKPFKGRLLEDNRIEDTWSAKKAHPGQIQFRVRGWMTKDSGGDWVSAFSPDLVQRQ
jgi:hypothetical protein